MVGLTDAADRLERANSAAGEAVAWALPVMVAAQAGAVVLRYAFGVNLIFVQESILFLHALVFLLGAAAAFARDAHVRVDLLQHRLSARAAAVVDLLGILIFLLPFCCALAYFALPYVWDSVRILEGSREATGLHLVFLLKTTILGFAGLLFLQGVARALRCLSRLSGAGR